MPYTFRLRCNIGTTCFISSDEIELVLASRSVDDEDVVLVAADGAEALREARKVVIKGRSYELLTQRPTPASAGDGGSRQRLSE